MPSRDKLVMTRQRRVILDELQRLQSHPTADEVYERVRVVLPRVSLGTVYRNLELMSEAGLIRKLHISGTQKRFDPNAHEHWHVRCVECGRLHDVPAGSTTGLGRRARDATGCRILGCHVEFVGICPGCCAEGLDVGGQKGCITGEH